MRPSQAFGVTREHAHFLSGNKETLANNLREQGNKTSFSGRTGKMEILKITFREQGHMVDYFREHGAS